MLDKIFNYPLNETKTIEIDLPQYITEDINLRVIFVVQDWLLKHRDVFVPRSQLDGLSYIGSDWVVQKGTYRGTFPKRYAQWLKDGCGIELNEEIKSTIGSIVRDNITKSDRYVIDIVNKMDWQDGDFGDEDSCFWGVNQRARDVIADHPDNFRIFRIHNYSARIILTKAQLYTKGDVDVVAFNAYGLHINKILNVIAAEFNASYTRVHLHNKLSHNQPLYINGNFGYVFRPKDETVQSADLVYIIPIDLTEYRKAPCVRCGIILRDKDYILYNDEIMCYSCRYEKEYV